ncbi:MAG: hypothetical protein K8T10_02080 [Candidatus Eremiobacteraeota bacterium]|nr:hypothetical protein [Candidatus Eremiobacteraeota bacterium]
MFLLNLIFVSITSIYFKKKLEGRKKRIMPALLFLGITIFLNLGYYAIARNKLQNYIYKVPVQDVLTPDPSPAKRDFSYLKKNRIIRDERFKSYLAVDQEGVILCLRSGGEPQVYDSSFYLTMQKEGKTFNTKKEMSDYARFVILLYYCESEPVYINSASSLARILKNRNNKTQCNLGQKVSHIISTTRNSKNKNKQTGPDETLKKLVARISPPKFEKDWDKGVSFNLYTFSFRYNELAQWKFKIFPNGNIEVEKTMSYVER